MAKETQKEASIRSQLQEKVAGYITAGFGLVASLAWNEAIKELIVFLYPSPQNTLRAKFLYALLLTLVLVGISAIFLRLQRKKMEKEIQKHPLRWRGCNALQAKDAYLSGAQSSLRAESTERSTLPRRPPRYR